MNISATGDVQVHANLTELTRIRDQITAAQLAVWGDHSSRIATLFGLGDNEIADVLFNDFGLAMWAIKNPELGVAVVAGITAVWSQLATLNTLCDAVQSHYLAGEISIDRNMVEKHELLEVAVSAPGFEKLGQMLRGGINNALHHHHALENSESLKHSTSDERNNAQNNRSRNRPTE
jgi:hypothetical protein